MDALMRMMRQTHHDAMNTSMFDAEAYSGLYEDDLGTDRGAFGSAFRFT
jgi:hypothetical protein